jgi:hypothetical protein
MITLIANDDTQILLHESIAKWSPYIMDAFWGDEFTKEQDKPLNVPFATGEQLRLFKQICEAKAAEGPACDFLPARGTLLIGGLPVQAPPFVVVKWMPALDRVMKALSGQEITDLLRVADAMCLWQLRDGLICLMLHKIVTEQNMFEEFFTHHRSSNLTQLIYKIYEEVV